MACLFACLLAQSGNAPAGYPGFDGFLPWRGSFMLDVVFLAMFLVIPVMGWSIRQVAHHKRYLLHKRVQVAIGLVLLVAVTLFEIDMCLHGWKERAEPSPYYQEGSFGAVLAVLWVHLCFSSSSALLWVVVIWRALRNFPRVPEPGPHSKSHRFWAKLAAIDLTLTAITGWIFYWLAFIAA